MSANHMQDQKPVSSTIRRGHGLLHLFSIAAVVAAVAAPLHAQIQTATPNPYTQMAPGVTGIAQYGQGTIGAGMQSSAGSTTQGVQVLGGSQGASAGPMTLLYPDPTQYVLAPGDLIAIRIYAAPDYAPVERISKDGSVLLPLIGSVNIGGITIRQAEDLIASRLKSAGMYRNPEITIGIAESSSPQTVSFVGEKSGLYFVQGQRNLLDVIAGAGGLPATAGRTVSIIRPGVEAPIVVNLGSTPQDLVKANIPVFAHDTIFIERAGAVYVLGAFKSQGAFPIQPGSNMTLMQAAALAGGPLYAGKYADMRIVRTIGTERQEVKVDIKRIMFGLDPDPLLQGGDILFLPTQGLKLALSSGGLQTLLNAVSILVIAAYRN